MVFASYFFINGDLRFPCYKVSNMSGSYFVEGYEKTNKFKEGRGNGQGMSPVEKKKGNTFLSRGLLGNGESSPFGF